MVWRWFGEWRAKRQKRKAAEAATQAKFDNLLNEAEKRRGDLTTAVIELREDRERRQAASIRPRARVVRRPAPAHQE